MPKYESIFVISDLHAPYHHPDSLPFFRAVKKKYKPDKIVCIGDEVDNHAMSYHESSPDLSGARDELLAARKVIRELESIFPKMSLIDSNHGSLYYRKAKTHGIPREALLPYNKLLGVGRGWKWTYDLTLDTPKGPVYFHHSRSSDVSRLSKNMGMSAVQGHHHPRFKIDYWASPLGVRWGMQVGCMIDDESYAFAYNKTTLERPIIGCGIILKGAPQLLPLHTHKGRWTGEL